MAASITDDVQARASELIWLGAVWHCLVPPSIGKDVERHCSQQHLERLADVRERAIQARGTKVSLTFALSASWQRATAVTCASYVAAPCTCCDVSRLLACAQSHSQRQAMFTASQTHCMLPAYAAYAVGTGELISPDLHPATGHPTAAQACHRGPGCACLLLPACARTGQALPPGASGGHLPAGSTDKQFLAMVQHSLTLRI